MQWQTVVPQPIVGEVESAEDRSWDRPAMQAHPRRPGPGDDRWRWIHVLAVGRQRGDGDPSQLSLAEPLLQRAQGWPSIGTGETAKLDHLAIRLHDLGRGGRDPTGRQLEAAVVVPADVGQHPLLLLKNDLVFGIGASGAVKNRRRNNRILAFRGAGHRPPRRYAIDNGDPGQAGNERNPAEHQCTKGAFAPSIRREQQQTEAEGGDSEQPLELLRRKGRTDGEAGRPVSGRKTGQGPTRRLIPRGPRWLSPRGPSGSRSLANCGGWILRDR